MLILKPSYQILTDISEGGIDELRHIEWAARTCYKSEGKITSDGESAKKLVASLISNGHEAMLEHSQLSVKFICDRGISHELVRHRICSFAQESTRYCNYMKDHFGRAITVIQPFFIKDGTTDFVSWYNLMERIEGQYFDMLHNGFTPQEARCVLPNCLKTEVVMTANYREWRNIFKLRCAEAAHPQMRELMRPLLDELKQRIPIIFDDIHYEGENSNEHPKL